jgi:hypothetical protein
VHLEYTRDSRASSQLRSSRRGTKKIPTTAHLQAAPRTLSQPLGEDRTASLNSLQTAIGDNGRKCVSLYVTRRLGRVSGTALAHCQQCAHVDPWCILESFARSTHTSRTRHSLNCTLAADLVPSAFLPKLKDGCNYRDKAGRESGLAREEVAY